MENYKRLGALMLIAGVLTDIIAVVVFTWNVHPLLGIGILGLAIAAIGWYLIR